LAVVAGRLPEREITVDHRAAARAQSTVEFALGGPKLRSIAGAALSTVEFALGARELRWILLDPPSLARPRSRRGSTYAPVVVIGPPSSVIAATGAHLDPRRRDGHAQPLSAHQCPAPARSDRTRLAAGVTAVRLESATSGSRDQPFGTPSVEASLSSRLALRFEPPMHPSTTSRWSSTGSVSGWVPALTAEAVSPSTRTREPGAIPEEEAFQGGHGLSWPQARPRLLGPA